MKWAVTTISYLTMPFDIFLGNYHWVFVFYPAEDEWYISDVCVQLRIALWITLVAILLLSKRHFISWPLGITLTWYAVCAYYDVLQTVVKSNGSDPTIEIIIFLLGAALIHSVTYFKNNTRGIKKK